MAKHDVAFYAAVFFIIGVALASLGISLFTTLFLAAIVCGTYGLFAVFKHQPRVFWLAGLSVFMLVGSLYAIHRTHIIETNLPIGEKAEIGGVIVTDPELRPDNQRFVMRVAEPYVGSVRVSTTRHPAYRYGDHVQVSGKVEELNEFTEYLARDGISATVSFAEVTLKERTTSWRAALFTIKRSLITVFERSLPAEQAAFLGGITLGQRAGFPQELTDAMKASGTTHLVALSGYNIAIIVASIGALFAWLFRRRMAFALTVLVIIAFVIMTGAEASVVRAAIMGGLILLADQAGRLYSFRNSIAAAAFGMVLVHPQVLVFDLGFQLSFMALFGIVYVKPALALFLGIVPSRLGGWRDVLLTTTAAQIAVLPLLIFSFGSVSLFSIVANMAVLGVIPLTTGVGFAMAGVGLLVPFLGTLVGGIAYMLVGYELWAIRLFGSLPFAQITFESVPWWIIAGMYFLLFLFVFRYRNRVRHSRENGNLVIAIRPEAEKQS